MIRPGLWLNRSFVPLLALVSATSLSACRPWLASNGVTNSPYRPEQEPQAQSEDRSKTVQPSPSPRVSPSPGPTQRPNEKDSLTLLSDEELEKHDRGGSFDEGKRRLKLVFNEEVKLSGADSAGSYCHELWLQDGEWSSKRKDDRRFACSVAFCAETEFRSGEKELRIPKGSVYRFKRFSNRLDSKNIRYVRLTRESGGTQAGMIEVLSCDSGGESLLIGDLIRAFGTDEKNKDRVDVRIEQEVKDPKRRPSSVDTAPLMIPAPKAEPKTADVSMPGVAVMDAAAPAVSVSSRREVKVREEMSPEVHRPNFGVQATGSLSAFGGNTISPAQQGVTSQALLLEAEYQPSFLQSIGVLGIGPSIGFYPTGGRTETRDQKVTTSYFSLHQIGAQARYQMRYWDRQLIVPFASYEMQSLRYNIIRGGSGRLRVAGGSAGLAVLINRFAPTEAKSIYYGLGVKRSYFVAEMKTLVGSDANVSVSGRSFYFGVRCEL